MSRIVSFYRSVIGKKVVVAVTGIILFAYVVGHMAGNLKSFLGTNAEGVPEVDVYAHFLRTVGEPLFGYGELLWIVRFFLLIAVVLHIVTVIHLTVVNRTARPDRYVTHANVQSTLAARLMLLTGVLLLAFIVVHILQFTTGTIDPARYREGEVYGNLHRTFQAWYYMLLYVVAMVLLAFHVYHGVWSMFQTLGLDNPDRNRGLRFFAAISAVVLLVGFVLVPVLFFSGAMPQPPDVSVISQSVGGE